MRVKRKFLAMLLATSMVLGSSVPALAATEERSDLTSRTVSGNGAVVDTGKDIIKVKLPATHDLVLDADGAYGAALKHGGTLSAANLSELEEYKGKILSKEKLEIGNLSSVPITVSVEFKAVKSGSASVNFITTSANDVKNGTAFNVWMAAVPSTTDIKGSLSGNYHASEKGFIIDDTASPNAVKIYLEAPVYTVSGSTDSASFNKTIGADEKGHGQAFDIIGAVNTKVDWSKRTGGFGAGGGILKVDTKFTLVKATTADKTDFDTAKATGLPYGYIGASSNLVATGVAAAEKAPSIATTTATFSKASGAEITVNLGTGSLKATGIKSVATVGGDGKKYTWAASEYSLDGTTLKMNKTAQYLAGVASGNTRKVEITFNDSAETLVELTVSITN